MTMHTPIAQLTKPTEVPGVAGAAIIATVDSKDRDGNYPAFIALAKREGYSRGEYSTHLVYFNDDRGEWFSSAGHYDIPTEAQARAAFATRTSGEL